MPSLKDKTVLIIGRGSGIAGAIALAVSDEGGRVIAAGLHLSPGTVRNHLSAAIQKLGAHNRADAAQIAQEKGWL